MPRDREPNASPVSQAIAVLECRSTPRLKPRNVAVSVFHSERPYFAGYMVSELHAEPDRIARLMARRGKIPLDVIRRQLREAARAGTIRPISAEQFVVNLMGLLIFPFAIRAALGELLSLDATRWRAFLEERRRTLPDFFMAGLRP